MASAAQVTLRSFSFDQVVSTFVHGFFIVTIVNYIFCILGALHCLVLLLYAQIFECMTDEVMKSNSLL